MALLLDRRNERFVRERIGETLKICACSTGNELMDRRSRPLP